MEIVTRHVTLPTDLVGAWDLLTRPEDQAGWLGAEVVLDPTPGAAGRVRDHDGTVRHLVVERAEAGERLAWRWWVEGDDESGATTVEVTLVPDEAGTVVTVVEQAATAPLAALGRDLADYAAVVSGGAE